MSSENRPKSRAGKVHIGAWVDPEFRTRLKVYAAQSGRSVEAIVEEAVTRFLDQETGQAK